MIITPQNISDEVFKLSKAKLLALDTETTGLEEYDKAFAVIIANETEEFYFDFRSVPNFVGYLSPLLENENLTLIFQNAKFDLRMLASIGLTVGGRCVDITSVARIVRNDHMEYSLAAQAKRVLGISKGDQVIKDYIRSKGLYRKNKDFFGEPSDKSPCYDKVPINIMYTYACLDARLTYDLYKTYLPQIDAQSFNVLKVEEDLIKVCYKMERTGLKVNAAHTIKAYHYEVALCKTLREEYFKLTGLMFVNSAKSVAPTLKYTLPLTEDGNPSLTDDVLEVIIKIGCAKDKEIAHTVRLIRMYEKRVSTYYTAYLTQMDKYHVIHPTMWIAGTRTGRFSYSNPNLQQMVSGEDTQYQVRECFMPREGYNFVSIDYQAQEYRVMVDYAGQTNIIEQVMQGKDFHQVTADMFGVTRKQAKTIAFMILYGGGDNKLAESLGIPLQQARLLKNKFFMALPKVEQLVDGVISVGRGRGYVVNWAGRKLFADKEFCYTLPNHLIQGSCADTIKLAMVRIDKFINDKDIKMILSIHDELVFEVANSCMHYVKDIQSIMESSYKSKNGIVLKTEASISKTSLAKKDMIKYEHN